MPNHVNDYVSVDVVNVKLTPLMYKKGSRKATATLVTPKETKRPRKPALHYDQFIRPEFRSPEQSARTIISDESTIREISACRSGAEIEPMSIYSSNPSSAQSLSAPTRSVLTPTLSERSSSLKLSPIRPVKKRSPFRYLTSTPNKVGTKPKLGDTKKEMESPIQRSARAEKTVASDNSAFQKCSLIRGYAAPKSRKTKDALDPRVWRRVEYGGVHFGSSEVSYSDDGRPVYKTMSTPTSGGAGNATFTVVSTQLETKDDSLSKYSEPQSEFRCQKRQNACQHNFEPYCCTKPCHESRIAAENAFCPTEDQHKARSVIQPTVSKKWNIVVPSFKLVTTIVIGLQFIVLLVYRFFFFRYD